MSKFVQLTYDELCEVRAEERAKAKRFIGRDEAEAARRATCPELMATLDRIKQQKGWR